MNRLLVSAIALSLAAVAPATATTVIDFDDLTGDGYVPSDYAGLNWASNFSYYDQYQWPYTAHSGQTRIYGAYSAFPLGFSGQMPILVGAGSVFDGAWFAGVLTTITLSLYSGGVLQTEVTSGTLSGTPQFLATNWTGGIDEIRISSSYGNGYWVGDDFTFDTLVPYSGAGGAVPEPAAWAMMIAGFGLVGAVARRRRVGAVAA